MANGDPFLDELNRLSGAGTGTAAPPPTGDPFLEELGFAGEVGSAEGFNRGQLVGQAELGTERIGTGTRGLMSMGDTIREKREIFNKRFPDGEFRRLPGTKDYVFREDPSKPFSPVDPKEWSLREGFADVVEFFGEDAGPFIGETLALIACGSGSLATAAACAAGGAFLGELAEEAGEVAAGVSREPLGVVGGRAVAAGALGAAGVPVGRALEAPFRVARGGGVARISPEARSQVEASEVLARAGVRQDLGLSAGAAIPPTARGRVRRAISAARPTLGQVSDSPIIRRLEGQGGAVGSALGELQTAQARTATTIFDRLRNPRAVDDVLSSMERVEEGLRNRALAGLRTTRVPFTEAGPGLRKAVAEADDQAKTLVNGLFERARRIEEGRYNIAELQQASAVSQVGVRGAGREADELVQITEPEGRLRDLLTRIQRLNPDMETVTERVGDQTVTLTPTDQLRRIRSELFDLKTAPIVGPEGVPVTSRAAQAEAGRLFAITDNILFNPSNSSQAAVKALRKANAAARRRFSFNEKSVVIEAAKTETPVALARRLVSPGQFDNLKTLRSVVSNKRFRELQDAFKTDLLAETRDPLARLNALEPEMRRMLMSPADEKLFRRYGESVRQINALDLKGIAARQGEASAAIDELVRTATPGQVDTFARSLRGMTGQDRLAFRAGLVDYLWRNSTFTDERGLLRVNADALDDAFVTLARKNLAKLIPGSSREVRRGIGEMARLANISRKDAGTSILAAGITRKAVREPLQGNVLQPLFELAQIMGIGRTLSWPWVRRLLVGTGKTIEPSAAAGILGAGLAQSATDLDAASEAITGAVTEGSAPESR